MARGHNSVTLVGNLTRDPEMRQLPSGQSVCNFSLAVSRSYKDQSGEWVETADYIDIVAWGSLGERVNQYMAKGRRCLVTGRLQSRAWEQDGQKRSKVDINAAEVMFLDSRGGGDGDSGGASDDDSGSSSTGSSSTTTKKKDTVIEDIGDEPINLDDIPF